jgi:hypothetical protein
VGGDSAAGLAAKELRAELAQAPGLVAERRNGTESAPRAREVQFATITKHLMPNLHAECLLDLTSQNNRPVRLRCANVAQGPQTSASLREMTGLAINKRRWGRRPREE